MGTKIPPITVLVITPDSLNLSFPNIIKLKPMHETNKVLS